MDSYNCLGRSTPTRPVLWDYFFNYKWLKGEIRYVYDASDGSLEGTYSTVECYRKFKMGYETLAKRLLDGKIHKGYLFSREPKN
jgi:hypothetical protein